MRLIRHPGENFESVYKRARGYIEACVINEKNTLQSVQELTTTAPAWSETYTSAIEASGKNLLTAFDAFAETKARTTRASISFKSTELEVKAETIVPIPTSAVTAKGYRGFSEAVNNVAAEVKQKYPVAGRMTDLQELARLCNGKNNALDIKKMLDVQMKEDEVKLQDVINYINILKEAGLVTL